MTQTICFWVPAVSFRAMYPQHLNGFHLDLVDAVRADKLKPLLDVIVIIIIIISGKKNDTQSSPQTFTIPHERPHRQAWTNLIAQCRKKPPQNFEGFKGAATGFAR